MSSTKQLMPKNRKVTFNFYTPMETKIRKLVAELERENEVRSQAINSGKLSDYNHTVKVHTYNNTLDIISRIQKIIGK